VGKGAPNKKRNRIKVQVSVVWPGMSGGKEKKINGQGPMPILIKKEEKERIDL